MRVYMRIVPVLLCTFLVFGYSAGLRAQASAGAQNQASLEKKEKNPHALDRLTKRLNLTTDQQTKLKPILEDEQKQIEAARKDETLSRQDQRARIAQIRRMTKPQIEAILTPDQQKKFDQMKPKKDED
jgi:protein CpxP